MMQFLSDKDIVVFDLDDTLYKEIDYLFSAYHAIAESIRLDVAGEMLDWYHAGKNVFLCLQEKYSVGLSVTELLAVFEVRVRDLMALCDQQKRRIDELTAALSLKDEELRQAKDMIEGLNAKCDNMLTARIVSTNEEEMKNARMRLSKLVREVDKCIALLNE